MPYAEPAARGGGAAKAFFGLPLHGKHKVRGNIIKAGPFCIRKSLKSLLRRMPPAQKQELAVVCRLQAYREPVYAGGFYFAEKWVQVPAGVNFGRYFGVFKPEKFPCGRKYLYQPPGPYQVRRSAAEVHGVGAAAA